MFALLSVKNLRKIQMIGLGSLTSLCREKKAKLDEVQQSSAL